LRFAGEGYGVATMVVQLNHKWQSKGLFFPMHASIIASLALGPVNTT
jgi:hypothetical protein